MRDRFRVRLCPEHGLVEQHSEGRCLVGIGPTNDWCGRILSEPFEVVRAVGARSSDPDTSKLAALRQAPRSGTQRARILDALQAYGPMSARNIERLTGIKGAWKRVSELKQGDHIYEARVEMDPVTGTEVTIYAFKRWTTPEPDEQSGINVQGRLV